MKMTWWHRRMGLLVLAGSILLTLPMDTSAQVTPLNSLVARVDQPRGPVPAECEQGLSPTPPLRVAVRDIELPANEASDAIAPPSGALRTALQETQIALTGNDRPAFDAALARAKALLVTYPAGSERRAAEEIVRLHETAARLWDTQYETPFFSQTDPEYALVSGLPGYAEAVRRSTLTDDQERRFYPTAESRDFVAQVAGERLQRLGIRGGTRSVRDERVREERPRPARASTSPRRSTTSPRRSTASSPSRASTPTRKPAAATPTVAAAPAPAPATSSVSPSPVAGDVSSSTTSTPEPATTSAPATDTATVTTATEVTTTTLTTSTTASDTVVTSTDVVPEAPSASRGRSVILPAILILIGLGVLIVLFRASK